MPRLLTVVLLCVASLGSSAVAQDITYGPQGEQIPGPHCGEATQWYFRQADGVLTGGCYGMAG